MRDVREGLEETAPSVHSAFCFARIVDLRRIRYVTKRIPFTSASARLLVALALLLPVTDSDAQGLEPRAYSAAPTVNELSCGRLHPLHRSGRYGPVAPGHRHTCNDQPVWPRIRACVQPSLGSRTASVGFAVPFENGDVSGWR